MGKVDEFGPPKIKSAAFPDGCEGEGERCQGRFP